MKTIIKLFCFTLVANTPVYAEVITDGSLGSITTLSGQMEIPQSLGTTTGNNLFHSFNRFNINTGESVTFTGDNSLNNVISRVTGGQISVIDGLLQSTIGNANFYFINPAGVMFGANAQIDVPAAFYMSTADTLKFADGSQFSATNFAANTLSIAEPTSFGFLNNQGGNIEVQDSTLEFKETNNVSLSAHNVTINNGWLTNAGNLQVYATGNTATDLAINAPVTQTLTGRVALNKGSWLDANFDTGGKITVQGGDIVVDDGSAVTADTLGSANAGGVSIKSNSLSVLNGGRIGSSTEDTGNAGNVTIDAGNILVDGQGSNRFTGIISNSNNDTIANAGNAATVSIKANNVKIANGGQISSDAWGSGNAGNVVINAANVLVDGQGNGAWISSNSNNEVLANAGNAGSVSITGTNVNVLNRGQISSDAWGTGNAGNATVNAANVSVDGQGDSAFTGIASNTNNEVLANAGNAGTVNINANNLSVSNYGQIVSDTWGSGNAGNIAINASNISVDGQGNNTFISSSSRNRVLSNAGNAGLVNVHGNNISVSNAGQIATITSGTGNAGNINIHGNNTVINNAKIFSDANAGSAGNAGTVIVENGNLITVQNGALISSSTSGAGSAGHVIVNAPVISVDNASISAEASAQSQGQTGNVAVVANQAIYLTNNGKISLKNDANIANTAKITPSSITVSAPDIDLKNSEITTAATGNVDAADININFSHALTMDPSFISTTANTGNGGDITIRGGGLISLQNSGFLTSVNGANSNGGNINVSADQLVMNTGVIQANAVGGSGGNINLNVKALIPSQNNLIIGGRKVAWKPFVPGLNVIQAASENGVSGTVNITSPQFDISASVSGLDSAQLVIPAIDNNLCQNSAMLASSLARAGQGGIPADESLYSFIPPATLQPETNSSTVATSTHANGLSGESFPCASLQP